LFHRAAATTDKAEDGGEGGEKAGQWVHAPMIPERAAMPARPDR
jgi:hypothetical protein